MTKPIHTNKTVIVLGDRDTATRAAKLTEKAAEHGATITETHAFDMGEAASHHDLTDVEEVVTALRSAISTRTDIWVPFPMPDLCREQHVRRLSLVLQRHGLDLLLGRELAPCPTTGGYNEVDFALRSEVRAVDTLDHAAIASAGMVTLSEEIERALTEAAEQSPESPAGPTNEPADDADVPEKSFSTTEAAQFFGESVQWIYSGLREKLFTHLDGSAIEPIRVGTSGRRRFTMAVLRDMALSCYRRGIFSQDQLEEVLAKLSLAEIAQLAADLAAKETAAKAIRTTLSGKIVQAKDAGLSSYAIAKEAGLSQPRVMQIIKGSKEHA
ncbi:hypothetical protein [Mycobacterium mantenii]|uniref:DUF7229 domain-containing protein n=1 Tax=Mycobacterium mantenii TaxID=560555 RepID=A0A1A2T9R0_MYCNT|nr:hypothetical protein [Mycobacterium mantenii]OBH47299.1 hypothetical protein A5688_03075 [Mycobacterium mantenii]OBH73139.1 hypothetical protein A5683_25300 [Mycobacterium mantenii]